MFGLKRFVKTFFVIDSTASCFRIDLQMGVQIKWCVGKLDAENLQLVN